MDPLRIRKRALPARMALPLSIALALPGLLALTSCLDESEPLAPAGPHAAVKADSGRCDPAAHEKLAQLDRDAADIVTSTLRWTIDCSANAAVAATPDGWPAEYEVGFVIPAGAVPETQPGYPLVEFAMDVPVDGPPGPRASVPYELHPDGIRFREPVTVIVCWPPWAAAADTAYHQLVHLEHVERDGERHYRVTDADTAAPRAGQAGFTARVGHFSRWDLTEGDGEGDTGGDGGKSGGPVYVAGDSCWTATSR